MGIEGAFLILEKREAYRRRSIDITAPFLYNEKNHVRAAPRVSCGKRPHHGVPVCPHAGPISIWWRPLAGHRSKLSSRTFRSKSVSQQKDPARPKKEKQTREPKDPHLRCTSSKFRLYPTKKQVGKLEWMLRRCKELYNAALQERRDAYRMCGISLSYQMQAEQLPAIKQLREEYKDIHSQVLQEVLRRLDKAFQAFFRRVMNGEEPGYPRFVISCIAINKTNRLGQEVSHRNRCLAWRGIHSVEAPAFRRGVLHDRIYKDQ